LKRSLAQRRRELQRRQLAGAIHERAAGARRLQWLLAVVLAHSQRRQIEKGEVCNASTAAVRAIAFEAGERKNMAMTCATQVPSKPAMQHLEANKYRRKGKGMI
jgi:hypothetical protein